MIIIDIETGGLDPLKHALLSIGAVDHTTGETFYIECRAESDAELDDAALAINGFTRAQALDPAKPSRAAAYLQFLAWAAGRPTLVGGQQVGAFDLRFLRVIHDSIAGIVSWPFGHRSVDLHSVAYAKLGQSLGLDGILKAVGLAPEPKPHHALTGARLEHEAFKVLLS